MSSLPVSTIYNLSARGHFLFSCVIVMALFASTRSTCATRPAAIVTILQGGATVVRAVSEFSAIEGVRLLPDDLLRTDKDSFLRIEYEDGTWIELGPDSRLELGHPAERRAKGPALYLLSGWMKIGCATADNGAKKSIASTGMDLTDISGTFIIRTVDATHMIFAEQGAARWIDREPHATDTVALTRGDFLITVKGKSPEVHPRPSPDFIGALPVEFRDSLPIRYPQFASRNVVIKDQHAFVYADVEQWLDAEPSIRRQFIPWWRRKAAQDEAFRASLDHNLSLHPEWDPVLHPEKYETDGTPSAQTNQ
jgi:hypothetical protein